MPPNLLFALQFEYYVKICVFLSYTHQFSVIPIFNQIATNEGSGYPRRSVGDPREVG
jgi:hypothetical protein